MLDFGQAIDESMGDETPADIEMAGEEVIQIHTGATATNGENGAAFPDDEDAVVPTQVTFIDHLKSPVVELLIGEGEDQTLLTAHQALLVQSPFFEDACSQFSDNAVVWNLQFIISFRMTY